MPSMADNFPFGVVTIWTAASFDTGKGKQKSTEKAESGYYFVSEEFNTVNAVKLSNHLHSCHASANNSNLPFIVIARVEGETPWLSSQLCTVFPGYPADAIRDIVNSRRQQRGTVALPKMDKRLRTLSFSMQYPYIHSNGSECHATKLKINRYKFAPIVTWISTATELPTILLVCRDEEIPRKLQSHLVSCNWQHSLLGHDPARIFVDLLVLLADWAEVLMIAQQELAQRNIQVHTDELPLLRKTKELHRDAEEIIALREDLRLHITAVRKFSLMVNAHRPTMTQLGFLCEKSVDPVYDAAGEDLDEQIEECLQNLLHQQESAAVIHKQLENLLSLAFNTEMVSQGQAVARLNSLAFIFLPLSFVATLFGMTRFTISAAWYPLWAFVVVVLVLLGFLAANHVPSNLLKTLSNKLRATTPAKETKETKPPPKSEGSTPKFKFSELAWMKPNYRWWFAVPVIGWCIIFFYRRRKLAKVPSSAGYHEYIPPARYGPGSLGYDPDYTKVSTPMPHSYLRGAGLHQPNYPVSELQPYIPNPSQQELWSQRQIWPRPSTGSGGPQIEPSNIRQPSTSTPESIQGSRV